MYDDSKERKCFIDFERKRRGLLDRPKISSILPIWKLAPCFPYYSSSVVKNVFRKEEFDFLSVSNFISDHFDLKRVNRKGYAPSGFRSDGFQVQISYMALKSRKPCPTRTEKLCKTGYQVSKRTMDLET